MKTQVESRKVILSGQVKHDDTAALAFPNSRLLH